MPENKSMIEYYIVEVPEVCASAQELFKDDIQYLNALPGIGSFDLVHSASALQYIDNWQEIVHRLASYNSEYILLSDVFSGKLPTFVTLQNYYDSKIRHWFLNLDELLSEIQSLGYILIMKTHVASKRNGVEDILPMSNFPEKYRLNQTLHLLFKRS
jgi:putative methyltransferase (TIGR04325 family)